MNELDWHLLEDKNSLEFIEIRGVEIKIGDRVVLRPRPKCDIFDLALTGRTATIEAIEQDYENNIHLAVIIDDDPGKDMGFLRQPGHRFFFTPDEVEPFLPGEFEELSK